MRNRLPLAAGVVGVVVLRAVMSTSARYPRVVADEVAYLGMARLMAGGTPWDLGLASTYGPGYAVLLVPWFALDLSPDAVYRAAIVTNIALAALTFLAFEALARRIPRVTRPLSIGLAVVATSLPALVATTNLAWSDDLAPLAFALLVLAIARVIDRPAPATVVVLAVATAGGYAVHGRFLPLAAVVVAVLAALVAGGRLPLRVAALGVAGIVVGLGLVQVGSQALYDRLYDPNQVTQGLNEADRITKLWPLALSGTGQLWTIIVTTGGLAGLGLITLVSSIRPAWRATAAAPESASPTTEPSDGEPQVGPATGRLRTSAARLAAGPRSDDAPALLLTLALLALVALAFLVSVVFMTDRGRGDHLVYGRYNDLFIGPLVLWGGAALALAASRARTAVAAGAVAVVALGTAYVLWRFRRATVEGGYLVYPVLGVVAVDPEGPPAMRTITITSIVILALLVGLALTLPRRPRATAVVVVAALLCVVGSERAVDRIRPADDADPADAEVVAEVLPDGARLAWVTGDRDHPLATSFYRNQLYMPDNPSVRIRGAPWEDGEPYVMAGARLTAPAAAGYRLAWVEAGSKLGLWVAPGERQDELAAIGELLDAAGFETSPGGDDGSVRFVDGPTIDDGRIRATVEVDRPTGAPWPAVSSGADPLGRVRVGVTVEGERCGCVLLDGRGDFGRWVRGADDQLTVDVDLELEVPEGEEPLVTVQLLREGVARFGTVDTAPPG